MKQPPTSSENGSLGRRLLWVQACVLLLGPESLCVAPVPRRLPLTSALSLARCVAES